MKEALLESAAKLVQPPRSAFEEYGSKRDILVVEMNKAMHDKPGFPGFIGGESNISVMENNHENHARFMQSLFMNYDPETFVNIICWVYRAYRSHGFNPDYWPLQLSTWLALYREHLSKETYEAIVPLYRWILDQHQTFVALSTTDK